MAEKLTIYYSIENGGDGSAYPRLYDTEKLAEWHQDHLDECWGEPCTGEIVVEGDNLLCKELLCSAGYYLKLLLEGYENDIEVDEFKDAFFADGLPEFTVGIFDTHYYGIYVDGRLVYKMFSHPETKTNQKGVKELTKTVNS